MTSTDVAWLCAGWSCDERNRNACRNPHGCHCREITALQSERDSLRARLKEAEKVIEPLTILAEDSAATLSKNNSNLAPEIHSLALRARAILNAKETA